MNPGFMAENEGRSYPFQSTGIAYTLTRSDSAVIPLPTETIVELIVTIGTSAQFNPATHRVFLSSITRNLDGSFLFVIGNNAPGAATVVLQFTRNANDPEFQVSRGTAIDTETGHTPTGGSECVFPLVMDGFLITGLLGPLEVLLAPGQSATGSGIYLEPSLIRPDKGAVNGISVANTARIMALETTCDADGNPIFIDPTSPLPAIYVKCLRGDVLFLEGYNIQIVEDVKTNTLTVNARLGAGFGQPPAEIPIVSNEEPPPGSPYLSGGPACDDTLLSVNGVSGPELTLQAGPGVTIEPHPFLTHRLIVSFDMTGLAVCTPLPQSSITEVSEILSSLADCE